MTGLHPELPAVGLGIAVDLGEGCFQAIRGCDTSHLQAATTFGPFGVTVLESNFGP